MRKLLASWCVRLYAHCGHRVRNVLRKAISYLEGGQAFSIKLREIMSTYHGIEIGIGTYGPCFDLDKTWVGCGNLSVGRYCSIASGVSIFSRNHPYWNPSTSPLFYNSNFNQSICTDSVDYGKLSIGNDVWIGQYAVVLPSCHIIGDGAVVGAGAIVTKDVPPYAVVVGNPAKVIKYRFNKETIDWLEEIKWWDWDVEELKQAASSFQSVEALRKYVRYRNGDQY